MRLAWLDLPQAPYASSYALRTHLHHVAHTFGLLPVSDGRPYGTQAIVLVNLKPPGQSSLDSQPRYAFLLVALKPPGQSRLDQKRTRGVGKRGERSTSGEEVTRRTVAMFRI